METGLVQTLNSLINADFLIKKFAPVACLGVHGEHGNDGREEMMLERPRQSNRLAASTEIFCNVGLI